MVLLVTPDFQRLQIMLLLLPFLRLFGLACGLFGTATDLCQLLRSSHSILRVIPLVLPFRWLFNTRKIVIKFGPVLWVPAADLTLAPPVIVLNVRYHTLFSPIVCIGVYHCIDCLEVFVLGGDEWRRGGLRIAGLGLCIFLEAVRLAVVIIVVIFDTPAAALVREELFRGISMLSLICSLSWEVHLRLELGVDEDFSFRVDIVLIVRRRKLVVIVRVIL